MLIEFTVVAQPMLPLVKNPSWDLVWKDPQGENDLRRHQTIFSGSRCKEMVDGDQSQSLARAHASHAFSVARGFAKIHARSRE